MIRGYVLLGLVLAGCGARIEIGDDTPLMPPPPPCENKHCGEACPGGFCDTAGECKEAAPVCPSPQCANKMCGDPCIPCQPGDPMCPPPMQGDGGAPPPPKGMCDQDSQCVVLVNPFTCPPPPMDMCPGKPCGAPCCPPMQPNCTPMMAMTACDGKGHCMPGPVSCP
jgi:hypothetical protein